MVPWTPRSRQPQTHHEPGQEILQAAVPPITERQLSPIAVIGPIVHCGQMMLMRSGPRIFFASMLVAAFAATCWLVIDRPNALSAACKMGLPNLSRPSNVSADALGCIILSKRQRIEGTAILDHHGGSLHTGDGGKPVALIPRENFNNDPLYARVQRESERAFQRYCVSAISMAAEGWIADTPGDRWGDRKFYIDHLIAVGPPAGKVVAVAMKAVPSESCPKPNRS
jgi:hypothetical protein